MDDSSFSSIRRRMISYLPGLALSPVVLLQPPALAADSMNNKVQVATNKRIGGLASKIRSVCNVMVRSKSLPALKDSLCLL
jgi:hypothetical protein